jgi:PHD/YefM family antitoxin component YafN of YafNO toxin-antitoxin module
MQKITNIQELKTAVNENGEMVITIKNNNIIMMKMEEYRKKLMKEDIEKHLLKAEDDIRNGRVKDAREVFKEWKEQ